ncbi:unnamed protein product [Effrenium voratum]|uniref:PPM-type phosphatase domain-containing protein n=1 Tax=Effrenium voratum TaxID=2562239 RepID=A0AA36HW72_9DINO|nr:unnamed protein product [Effrenium voratum]
MCLRFDDVTGAWIMVVADGHGRYGHLVASEICKVLPNMLVKALDEAQAQQAIKKAFSEAEVRLEAAAQDQGFDLSKSGAAVAAALLTPEGVVHLASCGDAQAVVVDVRTGNIAASRLHKAHDSREQQRILAAGGSIKVERPRCRNTVASRVYGRSPFGLAMSRSFGDLCVKAFGVIAEPSLVTGRVSDEACLILGSDGLFEFLAPVEALTILRRRACSSDSLALALVKEAQARWERNEAGLYCDDVSCLLLCPRGSLEKVVAKLPIQPPSLLVNPFGAESYDGPVGAY